MGAVVEHSRWVWSTNASTTLFLIPEKKHHVRKTRLRSPCCDRMEGKTQRHVNRLLRICGRCGKGGMRDVDGHGKEEPEQLEPLLRWWTQRMSWRRFNYVVWNGPLCFDFAQRVLRVLCGYFAQEPRVMFENNVSEPMVLIPAILPGSNWSVLLLRNVMQDAMRCVFLIFPEVGIRVYVDDMKPFQTWISMSC